MQDKTSGRSAARGRVVWLVVAGCLVLWQGAQATMLGVLGLPGVYTVPVSGHDASGTAGGAGSGQGERVTVVPKDAFRKRVEPKTQEPVADAKPERVARVPPGGQPDGRPSLPPEAALKRWLQSRAREFVGGVDDQGNILYRFDISLEAPDDLKPKVVEVAYDYDAPSVRPRSQSSKTAKGGFQVQFGALSCAGVMKVKVTFDDGRTQEIEADGCSLLK